MVLRSAIPAINNSLRINNAMSLAIVSNSWKEPSRNVKAPAYMDLLKPSRDMVKRPIASEKRLNPSVNSWKN